MSIRPKVPKSKHIDGNYDNGFIHHIMKAFSDNPLSPLIGIFQVSNEDISSKIAPNCIETYSQQSCRIYIKANIIQYTETYLKPPMSRWHDLGRHVLPARHVRCEWALVADNGKTKMSLSRSSRTNILKSPANAIWRPYGHYWNMDITLHVTC